MDDSEKLKLCLDFLKSMHYDSFAEGEEYGDGQDYVDGISEFYDKIIKK